MTKIYLIRHGFSDGNNAHIFTGSTDMDLCEKGFEQAKILAEYMKNVQIDRIYSSDLCRVVHTIEPTAKEKRLKIVTDRCLREIDGGVWEGMTYDEIGEKYPKEFDVWINDIDNSRCVGGESVAELRERVYGALLRIASENDGKTLAIATHATPIRATVSRLTGQPMRSINWVTNASITEVNFADGSFELVRTGYDEYLGSLGTGFAGKI